MPTYDLVEITVVNDEYIDKSYDRVIQLFNHTCLSRYLIPPKFVFENGSGFK